MVPKASVAAAPAPVGFSADQKSVAPWEVTPGQVTTDVSSAASSPSSRQYATAGATILGIQSVKEHLQAAKDPTMILFMQINT